MIRKGYLAVLATTLIAAGLAACEKQGPVEKVGEEIDEAVETVKEGGESVATKVDDAVDELRE